MTIGDASFPMRAKNARFEPARAQRATVTEGGTTGVIDMDAEEARAFWDSIAEQCGPTETWPLRSVPN